MAWIRIAVCLILFFILSQIDFLFLPVINYLTNWVIVLALAWFIGVVVTKKLILPHLPKLNPTGRAVLITGCDHGFGYSAAKRLSDMGFHVFAGCLNARGDGATKLRQEVSSENKLTILQMDVTKIDEIVAAENTIRDKIEKGEHGLTQLYAVVNNAGVMLASAAEAATVKDYERQWAINTMGPVLVSRKMLPLLRKSRGRLVTVSSIVARIVLPNLLPYSMSKAATSKFMEGLQQEVGRFGIRCISIEPWAVRTNLVIGKHLLQGMHDNWSAASDEIKRAYGSTFATTVEKTTSLLQNFPLNTTEEMVIDDIVDAIFSHEPELVYRVVRWELAPLFWLEDDYLPWHIVDTMRWISNRVLEFASSFT
jgi:NAD(P)-dependent dehydrogenase (short-subunit alcohol dehydrogenase family)